MSLGDVSADHDHRGVEEVDGAREHFAEGPACVPDHADRAGMAAPDEADDVAALRRIRSLGGQSLREGQAAGDRLQAADVAAPADHVLAARRPDVSDVARGAARASVDMPVRDDPAADPRADLDQEEVLRVAPV